MRQHDEKFTTELLNYIYIYFFFSKSVPSHKSNVRFFYVPDQPADFDTSQWDKRQCAQSVRGNRQRIYAGGSVLRENQRSSGCNRRCQAHAAHFARSLYTQTHARTQRKKRKESMSLFLVFLPPLPPGNHKTFHGIFKPSVSIRMAFAKNFCKIARACCAPPLTARPVNERAQMW